MRHRVPGTFDVTLRYDVDKAQWGTLRVYYGSAKDGSPQGIRDYPVWLTPATRRRAGGRAEAFIRPWVSSAGSENEHPRSGRGAAW